MPFIYDMGTPRADLGAAFFEYNPADTRFIAKNVLALREVGLKKASYPNITRETVLKAEDTKRAKGGAFNRISMGAEDKSYDCSAIALEAPLTAQDIAVFGNEFDAEMATVQILKYKAWTAQERQTSAAVFNTSTWTGAPLYTDYSSSGPWATVGTDIIGQIITTRELVRSQSGVTPNALIIGAATLASLQKNTGIKAMFPGAPMITAAMIEGALPAIFGLEKLLVGGGVYDSANEGLTSTIADVWSANYAMVARVANDNEPITAPCIGRTFVWNPGLSGITTDGAIVQYVEPQTKTNVYQIEYFIDTEIIEPYFGHLLKIKS